ncbi:hypothetical protein POTOM_060647 [Populus tomentosa]|uniref:Uncharacterized protein n=1 Tax=Populus tomentosa TaxID=118781 RepID=A0A8X7XTK2_POPTO|nr:hypothetical protein POTOM_060647 [Populus tomentosa]
MAQVIAKVDLAVELLEDLLGTIQGARHSLARARAALKYIVLALSGHMDDILGKYKEVKHKILFLLEMLEPFLDPAISALKSTLAFGDVSFTFLEKQEQTCVTALNVIRTAVQKPGCCKRWIYSKMSVFFLLLKSYKTIVLTNVSSSPNKTYLDSQPQGCQFRADHRLALDYHSENEITMTDPAPRNLHEHLNGDANLALLSVNKEGNLRLGPEKIHGVQRRGMLLQRLVIASRGVKVQILWSISIVGFRCGNLISPSAWIAQNTYIFLQCFPILLVCKMSSAVIDNVIDQKYEDDKMNNQEFKQDMLITKGYDWEECQDNHTLHFRSHHNRAHGSNGARDTSGGASAGIPL